MFDGDTHTHTKNLPMHIRLFIYTDEMSSVKQSFLEKEEEIQKLKQKLSQNESNYLLILALL